MSEFVRGMKVTTIYGEGIVVNLPIFNRIAVQYEDGIVRYFWPQTWSRDGSGQRRDGPHPVLILSYHIPWTVGVDGFNRHTVPLQQRHGWLNHRAESFPVLRFEMAHPGPIREICVKPVRNLRVQALILWGGLDALPGCGEVTASRELYPYILEFHVFDVPSFYVMMFTIQKSYLSFQAVAAALPLPKAHLSPIQFVSGYPAFLHPIQRYDQRRI